MAASAQPVGKVITAAQFGVMFETLELAKGDALKVTEVPEGILADLAKEMDTPGNKAAAIAAMMDRFLGEMGARVDRLVTSGTLKCAIIDARTFSLFSPDANLQVGVRASDSVISIAQLVQKMVQSRNFLPISLFPNQRLIITDIPAAKHAKMREMVNQGEDIRSALNDAFCDLVPPGLYAHMRGVNVIDIRANGTTVFYGTKGMTLEILPSPEVRSGGDDHKEGAPATPAKPDASKTGGKKQ